MAGRRAPDLTGAVFGRWLVMQRAENTKFGGARWRCVCACGTEREVSGAELRRGDATSCGCLQKELAAARTTTHGMSRTKIYAVWKAMMQRCYLKTHCNYAKYGARGVMVCKRWHSFENFYADMGDAPFKGASIDRIDNNGNYAPQNCRWATHAQQAANTSRVRMLEFRGDVLPLAAMAKKYGQPPLRVWQRLERGWELEAALTTPAREWKRKTS
jgi:hypothetical protein